MAEEDRSFVPKTAPANRARAQGPEPTTDADRPGEADFPSQVVGELDDRDAAGLGDAGDLGASTPPNVDVHDLAQEDKPQEDWGEPAGEDAMFSSTNTRRGVRTEAERGQGAKTRRRNKDIISRRT